MAFLLVLVVAGCAAPAAEDDGAGGRLAYVGGSSESPETSATVRAFAIIDNRHLFELWWVGNGTGEVEFRIVDAPGGNRGATVLSRRYEGGELQDVTEPLKLANGTYFLEMHFRAFVGGAEASVWDVDVTQGLAVVVPSPPEPLRLAWPRVLSWEVVTLVVVPTLGVVLAFALPNLRERLLDRRIYERKRRIKDALKAHAGDPAARSEALLAMKEEFLDDLGKGRITNAHQEALDALITHHLEDARS